MIIPEKNTYAYTVAGSRKAASFQDCLNLSFVVKEVNMKEMTTETMLATSQQVLRQEQVATLNKETNVMAYYISAMGVICGFGLNALQQDPVNVRIVSIIFGVLIPSGSSFFGAIWLDCIFRQLRLGNYLYQLENVMLQCEELDNAYGWEHFCVERNQKRIVLFCSRSVYYFSLALFILLPVFSVIFVHDMIKMPFYGWEMCSAIAYAFFLVFCVISCVSIKQLDPGKRNRLATQAENPNENEPICPI